MKDSGYPRFEAFFKTKAYRNFYDENNAGPGTSTEAVDAVADVEMDEDDGQSMARTEKVNIAGSDMEVDEDLKPEKSVGKKGKHGKCYEMADYSSSLDLQEQSGHFQLTWKPTTRLRQNPLRSESRTQRGEHQQGPVHAS